MSMLATIRTGRRETPPKCLIHGVAGIGKTTLGSQAPNPIFIFTEDSQGALDVDRFEPNGDPVFQTWEDVLAAIDEFYDVAEQAPYKTLVIDTVDGLEPLAIDYLCRLHKKANIEAFGYSKGQSTFLPQEFIRFLGKLDRLHRDKGIAIILLGHSGVLRFDDPETPYHRFTLRMHKNVAPIVVDWCSTVLFANYDRTIVEKDAGFGKTTAKAVGQGRRVIFTQERPSHIAKNRAIPPAPYKVHLPIEPEGAWETISAALGFIYPEAKTETQNQE